MAPVNHRHERTEHWHSRYENFKKEAGLISPGRIIFLGNSITEGFPLDTFFANLHPLNRGISGDHIDGLLERLNDSVVRLRPSKLFILIGINDINDGDPDAVILSNYQQLMQQLAAQLPQTAVFIQSILPTSPDWPNCPKEKINGLNTIIRRYCKNYAFKWIDLQHRFKNSKGHLEKAVTDDGLHLNGAGYRRWAKVLEPYIYD